MSIQKLIKEICLKQNIWKPGRTAVTDTRSFMHCLPGYKNGASEKERTQHLTRGGRKAYEQFIAYEKQGSQPPQTAAVLNAGVFLNISKRLNTSQDHERTAECSNFAYHALGTFLLNQEIQKEYDICQIGIMKNKNGAYMHNICVLIPKGSQLEMKKDLNMSSLPEGALIIDPWARALGHPAETTLGVPLAQFRFKHSFDPFIINYNSSNDSELTHTIKEFEDKTFKDYFEKSKELAEALDRFDTTISANHKQLKEQGLALLNCLESISGTEDKTNRTITYDRIQILSKTIDIALSTIKEINNPQKTNKNIKELSSLSKNLPQSNEKWKKLGSILLILAGIALFCVGLAAALPTASAGLAATAIGVGLITLGISQLMKSRPKTEDNKIDCQVHRFKDALKKIHPNEETNAETKPSSTGQN